MSLLRKIVRALLFLPPDPPPHDPYDVQEIRDLKAKRLKAERRANRLEAVYLGNKRRGARHG